jgi:hypothetical protein
MLVEAVGDAYTHSAPTGEKTTTCGDAVSFPKGGTGLPDCPDCLDGLTVPCSICGTANTARDSHVYGKGVFCKSHTGDEVGTWVRSQPL